MPLPASGSSLHCVDYGSVLCSVRQQTTLGLGPHLLDSPEHLVLRAGYFQSPVLLYILSFILFIFHLLALSADRYDHKPRPRTVGDRATDGRSQQPQTSSYGQLTRRPGK